MTNPIHGNGTSTSEPEQPVFELKPSAKAYAGLMVWGIVLLPVFLLGLILLLRVWYKTASIRYRLTTQRLFVQRGLIGKHIEEVELFRVKDVTVTQGALQRLLGVGTVIVLSSDDTAPRLELAGICDPVKVKETLRTTFRTARQREGMHMAELIPS